MTPFEDKDTTDDAVLRDDDQAVRVVCGQGEQMPRVRIPNPGVDEGPSSDDLAAPTVRVPRVRLPRPETDNGPSSDDLTTPTVRVPRVRLPKPEADTGPSSDELTTPTVRVPRVYAPRSGVDEVPTREIVVTDEEILEVLQNISAGAVAWEASGPQATAEDERAKQDIVDFMGGDTWILPVVSLAPGIKRARSGRADRASVLGRLMERAGGSRSGAARDKGGHLSVLRTLAMSSGVYALASVASPLISLVLAPFLTHTLSSSDYGILSVINTTIALTAGITQLGLASAFFRAYSYDYITQKDKRDVIATTTTLLCLISIAIAMSSALASSTIAHLLFGQSKAGNDVLLAGGVICVQNLTIPGLAWLRAEGRALFYSLLSIANLLVTLLATILLLRIVHLGVAGAIIANGAGYACIVVVTLPILVFRAGIKIRIDIARNLLSFGLPLVLNFVAYWVLQLSDRALLSLFTSFAETARYAVAYSLGSAISILVLGPFTIAWPATVFAIAKRKDAVPVFLLVFRWLSLFLLFAAFSLSLAGVILLDWLFPASYHSVDRVIPIIAASIVFYGVYYVVKSGLDIKRKTWLISLYTTIAALVNFILNLFLIPRYGAMGAAVSTLLAYMVLATVAYIVNRWIYPISFQVGVFIVALLIGIALYAGSDVLAHTQGLYVAWGIRIVALGLYGGCLVVLGRFLSGKRQTGL